MSSDGVYYTLVSDQVSSTALVVDASGNKVAETRYYPFGEERYTSGASPTDKTYTGQRSEDFGLMDYNARFYSPYLGKFISADTIIPDPGNVLAWDRYGYAYNNAIMYNDPSGHFTEDAIKEYLINTFGDAWKDVWDSWLLDEEWMNTLYDARTGDTLSHISYDPDGNAQIAHYTFEGAGEQELQGLRGIDSPDLYSVYRNSVGVGVVRPDEELGFDVIGKVGNIYYDINKISGFEAGLGETIIYGASFVLAGSFPPISSVAVAALDLGKIWYEKNRPETAFVGLSKGDVSLGISSFCATGENGGILTTWRYGFRYNVSGIYQTEHKGTLQIYNPY